MLSQDRTDPETREGDPVRDFLDHITRTSQGGTCDIDWISR